MTGSNSSERFIVTTAHLLQERGFAATNISDIIAQSGAPKGSLYFHFPGGKEELVAAAISYSEEMGRVFIRDVFASARTLREGFDEICEFIARELQRSNFSSGCTVGTVAAEAPDVLIIRDAVASAYRCWLGTLEEPLKHAGATPRRAAELATLIYAIVEGSGVLCKALQNVEPLQVAKREIARILRDEGLIRGRRAHLRLRPGNDGYSTKGAGKRVRAAMKADKTIEP